MNGTTVYKPRSIWQNTHLRLLKSCTEISSGFTCMMKNLCPGPLIKTVYIWTSFQQARCASLQRNMRVQRPQPGISSKLQVRCKLPKYTSCDTSILSCHMVNKRSTSPRPSQGPIQNKNADLRQASYNKKSFDPRGAHKQKDRCSKCGDSAHLEGFTGPAKKYQCKSCHKFGHFTSLCFMKGQQKQAYHKHRKPKAHQLTASTIQAYDSQ